MLRLDSGLGVSLGCPCGCKKATGAIEITTDASCYRVFHKEPAVGMTRRERPRNSCEVGKMLHRRPGSTVKAPLSALHFS